MIIVDAHQDIAFVQACYQRSYRQSAIVHREREADMPYPAATIGLPDALLGRVAIVFATLYVSPPFSGLNLKLPGEMPVYNSPREAHDLALKQLEYYQRLADEDPRVRLILSADDLDAVLATWEGGTGARQRQQGIVVLMEGADPIIEPKQYEEWYAQGVRLVGPAWRQTRYTAGTGAPGGLTTLGRDLLGVMNDMNALLDLSHMAERAFYEAIDMYDGTIIASHSNPRRFVNTDRHLSDEMIRLLAERDGVMGVVLYNRFMVEGWQPGDPRPPMSLIVDIIDHICQVTGSAAHVGIGSDFDGGFGADSIPQGLDTVMDLWKLNDLLRERGYAETQIADILGGNMLRKLRQVLPAR